MRSLRFRMVASVAMLLVAAVAGSARAGDPPGNNGTVKVNGDDIDGPGNDAHAGCAFHIEFRGYDAGDLDGTSALELVPPSGSGILDVQTVPIGLDAAGGANDLDAVVDVPDLTDVLAVSGALAQGQQGFHVKLTVSAEGSIGADTKHKTFWIACFGEGGGEGESGGEGEGGES